MSSSPGQYLFSTSPVIDEEAALALYESVGWTAYTSRPELLGSMFQNASHLVVARENLELVGLARVVGDGVTTAVIQDLIVHPHHQRRGLGRELLRRALTATEGIRQTYITTEAASDNDHVVALYEQHGFRPTSNEGLITLTLLR